MISYRPNNHIGGMATVSYSGLRTDFNRYSAMSDEEFVRNVHLALHFAIFCSWFKENTSQQVLADDGVVHELYHLLMEREGWDVGGAMKRLGEIRRVFTRDLVLS